MYLFVLLFRAAFPFVYIGINEGAATWAVKN